MLTIRLRHRDHTPLFSGDYRTVCDAVEDALRQNINLNGVDLSYLDLREINLDGIKLHDADFTGANLSGANLSEADFARCCFDNASLYNACLACSTLTGSTFIGTQCGGTDVAGANLSSCAFSGPSTLTLNLHEAQTLAGAVFPNDHVACAMSHAPLTLQGLDRPVTLFDDCALIGAALYHVRHGVWSPDLSGLSRPLPVPLQKAMMTLGTLRK